MYDAVLWWFLCNSTDFHATVFDKLFNMVFIRNKICYHIIWQRSENATPGQCKVRWIELTYSRREQPNFKPFIYVILCVYGIELSCRRTIKPFVTKYLLTRFSCWVGIGNTYALGKPYLFATSFPNDQYIWNGLQQLVIKGYMTERRHCIRIGVKEGVSSQHLYPRNSMRVISL